MAKIQNRQQNWRKLFFVKLDGSKCREHFFWNNISPKIHSRKKDKYRSIIVVSFKITVKQIFFSLCETKILKKPKIILIKIYLYTNENLSSCWLVLYSYSFNLLKITKVRWTRGRNRAPNRSSDHFPIDQNSRKSRLFRASGALGISKALNGQRNKNFGHFRAVGI